MMHFHRYGKWEFVRRTAHYWDDEATPMYHTATQARECRRCGKLKTRQVKL